MKFSNKMYDFLKWVSLVGLDALGVFYNEISKIWGLPCGDKIFATCVSASIMIGALIGISSINYNKNNSEG